MKKKYASFISILFLVFSIFSCTDEVLEAPQLSSLQANDFISHSKAIFGNTEFANDEASQMQKIIDQSFTEKWGTPEYEELIKIENNREEALFVVPLHFQKNDKVHNVLVGWQDKGSISLRIVHDNRRLTELTFDNTPINGNFKPIFDFYNSNGDASVFQKVFPIGCYEPISCPSGCSSCVACIKECQDLNGSGSNGTGDPHGGSTSGGGGTGQGGETTDPECTHSEHHVPADNPDCPDMCMGYFDFNCNGTLEDSELCMQAGISEENCLLAAQNPDLLALLMDNVNTPENLSLVENSGMGVLVSRTCDRSFKYVPISSGYTCQVNTVKHSYLYNSSLFHYTIPEMCIQVSGTDKFGTPLSPYKAAELSALAMDNARLTLFDEVVVGNISSNVGAKYAFRDIYRNALLDLTGGFNTSSITYGACYGTVPTKTYALNPLGGYTFCIDLW